MASVTVDDAVVASLPLLSRSERIAEFGIDCGEGLVWGGGTWGPGGEYIKRLIVKNLSPRILKIRYRLPKTKFFNMDFPDLFKLSPGTFKAIEVRFRPIRLEPYDDYVVFALGRGRLFKVPIRARLSKLAVSLPSAVDFESCPVAETTLQTFLLRNVGQIPAAFNWSVCAPFGLEPATGVVAPGHAATITASYSPTDASVVDATAVCSIKGEQDSQVLRLNITGTGKYPFISADEPNVSFGHVLVGSTDERAVVRTVTLTNPSDVPASFVIHPAEHDREPQFTLHPMEGVVPPGGALPIRVRYHPSFDGMFTCDHFDVVTPGGNTVRIAASGTAHGAEVILFRKEAASAKRKTKKKAGKPNSINFGDVELGKTVTRVVFLQNLSGTPAHFHFQVEDKGVFEFDRIQGVVPPLLQGHIIVSFTPKSPCNFYRRVFCLIRDQMPLFMDMLGTGYDAKRRPAPMLQRHIDAFHHRPEETKFMGPPELEDYIQAHGRFDASEQLVQAEQARGAMVSRSGEAKLGPLDVARQFFKLDTDPSRPVYILDPSLDFGHGRRGAVGERKTCRVVNNTRGKITVVMQVPESDDNDTVPDFGVSPESLDIAPGRTGTFRIAFMPTQENFYYSQEIEAYAFFKSNRTFRLVHDDSFTPPWCMAIRAFGHTFALGAEQYMSRVSFSLPRPSRLNFPPCHVGDCVYQTFEMTNTHDTPAAFNFRQDPAGVFTVKPAEGLIPLNSSQLITVRFQPRHAKVYQHLLSYTLNNAPDSNATIRLFGAGAVPRMTLPDGPLLCFKPTCLGVSSVRTSTIRNSSRIPLHFEWRVPSRMAGQLTVTPAAGVLLGNQALDVTWVFSPSASKRYSTRVPCLVTHAGSDTPDPAVGLGGAVPDTRVAQRLHLQVVGQGTTGALRFDPPALQFGTALVATKVHRSLVLENQSDAPLHFRMHATQVEHLPDGTTKETAVDLEAAGAGAGARRVGGAGGGKEEEKRDSSSSSHKHRQKKRRKKRRSTAGQVLVVSHPHGVVEARSRLSTMVVFAPSQAGAYSFRLCYEVIGTRGVDTPAAGSAAAAGRAGPSAQAAAAADVSTWGDNVNPLWCGVVGKAGYPTMTWEDARLVTEAPTAGSAGGVGVGGGATTAGAMSVRGGGGGGGGTMSRTTLGGGSVGFGLDMTGAGGGTGAPGSVTMYGGGGGGGGAPAAKKALAAGFAFAPSSLVDLSCPGSPWRLWKQLSLAPLNATLAQPLTAADLAFNAATQLKQRPEDLDTFVFDFTPAALGSPAMVVLASVRNTGRLHTDFSFRLPNEMEVELEPWAEVGEPTDEDLAQNAIIDSKVFDIQPRRGSLAPGEATTLRLHYNYNTMIQGGCHQVYVTLKLDKGKQVRLLLRGRTLDVPTPLLFLGDPLATHTLAPVPIGVMEPPVQAVPLFNAGAAPLRFMVDDRALRSLVEANYGFEVLRCLDRDGVIGPGERVFVRFVFRPLEAREYRVALDIVYTGDGVVDGDATTTAAAAAAAAVAGGGGGGGGGAAVAGAGGEDGGGIVGITIVGTGFRSPLVATGVEQQEGQEGEEEAGGAVSVSVAVGTPGLGMGAVDGLEEGDEDMDNDATVAAASELSRAMQVIGVPTTGAVRPSGGASSSSNNSNNNRRGAGSGSGTGTGAGAGAGAGVPESLAPVRVIGSTPSDQACVRFPHRTTPESMVTLSHEWLRFGDLPRNAVTYRLVTVRNTRVAPEGGWRPGMGSVAFAWDTLHPLIARRLVRIHPAQGRLAAGKHVVCKVTFSAKCPPEVVHTDVACVVSVPADEVRGAAEADAKVAAEAEFKAQQRKLRQRSKVDEAPHQSVMFRSTASRQAHLAATQRGGAGATAAQMGTMGMGVGGAATTVYGGDDGEYDAYSRAPGGSVMGSRTARGTPMGFRGGAATAASSSPYGGAAGSVMMGKSPTRGTTARSVRSRLSRTRPQAGPVIVPPAPTTSLTLHVNARVCTHQEFLLVHSRSRLAAFFNPKPFNLAAAGERVQSILDVAASGDGSGSGAGASAGAGAGAMGAAAEGSGEVGAGAGADADAGGAAAALEDVMATLMADLVNDADIANAFEDLPQDDVMLFDQLRSQQQAPEADTQQRQGPDAATQARLATLVSEEGQELVERVVENTLLNIIKEASFEEFSITQPPVSLVRLD